MSVSTFVLIAVLIEGLTGIVKSILQSLGLKMADWMDQAVSLVLSMTLAVAGKIDLIALVNEAFSVQLNLPAFVGIVLAGLVLSRGSNAVHDIFRTLNPEATETRIW